MEMQKNARNLLNLDQIIEMYDLKSATEKNSKRHKKENTKKLLNPPTMDTNTFPNNLNSRVDKNKKTLNFIVKNRANKLRFGKKIYEFYNAPITKFWQNTIIYILFLISFAYIVLVKTPKKPSIPEIFVLVYIFSYGLDKIREVSILFCFDDCLNFNILNVYIF
jgi:hypothetical protein